MGGVTVDKSVPRPPRHVQSVRDILCGPVVSGHRGHGRTGEVVVQHLSDLDGLTDAPADPLQVISMIGALHATTSDIADLVPVGDLGILGRQTLDEVLAEPAFHAAPNIGRRLHRSGSAAPDTDP
jgi:hypothetical protein